MPGTRQSTRASRRSLDHIRKSCKDLDLKKYNEDNERQLEQFITRIEAEFPRQAVVKRQRPSKWAVRTTRWNYLFTVPGESDAGIALTGIILLSRSSCT